MSKVSIPVLEEEAIGAPLAEKIWVVKIARWSNEEFDDTLEVHWRERRYETLFDQMA